MSLLHKKIYFVGGKGGVGKSTSSAALALLLSSEGKKVLLVSTDPAHNTGDIFHVKLKGKITPVLDGLHILEIDSDLESKNYIESVKMNLKGLVKSSMVAEVHRQIDLAATSPGAEEAALFDRITSIILDEVKNYDAIVFDTAPTGHTLRLLTLPELMGVWMDGLLERRRKVNDNYNQWMNDGEKVDDPIYEKLQERKNKFMKVRNILLDQQTTEYLFVLNAERLPILETKKAIETLKQHGIEVKTLIVNKLIPIDADGMFMAKRRDNEAGYKQEILSIFKHQRKIMIPLLEHDISSLEHLKTFSAAVKKEIQVESSS